MKRALSILLATVLLLTCIPLTAVSVSADTSGDYEYTVTDGKATITGYTGSGGAITIPSTLDGYPVTAIGDEAMFCYNLTSVIIPNSVTTIGSSAFWHCDNLTSVSIPASVTSIGSSPFDSCEKLTLITVDSDNAHFSSKNGVLFNKNKSVLIQYPSGKGGAYAIPNSVTIIGEHAFAYCTNLTLVTLPDSITAISEAAFSDCYSLTSISIPDSVTTIGVGAFACCDSLTSVTIPDSITAISEAAFSGCYNLTSVIIPNSVTTIGVNAFHWCVKLSSVIIPSSVTTVGESAFRECYSLTTVTISNQTTTIGFTAFNECNKLTDVYYAGSEASRAKISIDDYNDSLLNATWHYNSCIGKAKHTYTAATCTKAKTCKICGATSGSKLGHNYYKKVVTKATTTANGKIKNVCTRCNYTASTTTIIYKASKISLSKTFYTYDGKVKKPTLTVKDSKGNKIASSNYTVTYASGRKNAGTYKVTVKMKGKYTGTKTLSFKINPISASKCKVSLSTTSYTYDGKVKKPTVTVKNANGTKLTTSSYTVTYASGRKNVGTYKVTIKFKGNYTGTKTLTFKVNPAKTTVKSLTAGKKSLKVAITKKSTQVTGYQIQYSTTKSFKSYKSKTLTSYKTVSTSLTGLKAKTTYYVRVRTYKTVNGVKYYSGWSTIKYKKTK